MYIYYFYNYRSFNSNCKGKDPIDIVFSNIFLFFPFSAAIVAVAFMAYSDEPWIDVVRAEGFYYILIGIIVAFSAVLIDFLIDRQKKREYEKSPI